MKYSQNHQVEQDCQREAVKVVKVNNIIEFGEITGTELNEEVNSQTHLIRGNNERMDATNDNLIVVAGSM